MKRLLVLAFLGCGAASATDLPKKALVAPAPVVATNSFYIGAFGGIGLSPTQNELTFDGISGGVQKAWPTGLMAGGIFGYANTAGPLYYGFAFEAAYDFSRGGVDCGTANSLMTGQSCLASRKNGLLLQEVGELGLSLSQLTGYIPSSAQPANWPVPITVPASFASNFVMAARVGFAQRNVDLCAAIDLAGDIACGSKFISAPTAGLKLKFMASAQTEIFATWDHAFWGNGSSFTPAAAIPLFQNTVSIQQEDIFKAGFGYHF